MAQNDTDSLNEEITESIIKLDHLDLEREEQPRNYLLTVDDRVIHNYDGRKRIDSGSKCGRSSGY